VLSGGVCSAVHQAGGGQGRLARKTDAAYRSWPVAALAHSWASVFVNVSGNVSEHESGGVSRGASASASESVCEATWLRPFGALAAEAGGQNPRPLHMAASHSVVGATMARRMDVDRGNGQIGTCQSGEPARREDCDSTAMVQHDRMHRRSHVHILASWEKNVGSARHNYAG
jgi:hypothetical protein